jgi:hypothetical protein
VTLINERILRQADRIESHILSHFGREMDAPIAPAAISRSIFWPGAWGKVEFCGTLFSDIGFRPLHDSTVGGTLEQLRAFAKVRAQVSG